MQYENQNKKKEWVLRLDAVEQPLANADMAWDRLHARLNEKKKNKGILWYWAAAAVAIIIAGTIFIPTTKKEEHAVVKQVENKLEPPVTVQQVPAVNQSPPANKPLTKKKTKNKVPIIKAEEPLAGVKPPSAIITLTADTIAVIATAPVPAPPKKKLRVVHVNQLENYIEQKATRDYFTTNSKDGLIKIKLSPSN